MMLKLLTITPVQASAVNATILAHHGATAATMLLNDDITGKTWAYVYVGHAPERDPWMAVGYDGITFGTPAPPRDAVWAGVNAMCIGEGEWIVQEGN